MDKTDFIKEWWDSQDAVTLIARPRRFGKTSNISMLERFFSNKYKGQGELLKISISGERMNTDAYRALIRYYFYPSP